jgi:hypothetical protein
MPLPYVPPVDPTNYANQPGDGPLRIGGQSASSIPETAENLPSTQSQAVKDQQYALTIVRDLEAGGQRVRARGESYLPKAPGESSANYDIRLRRSVFFDVFGRTVDGLVGQVFRRDPIVEDVPDPIVQQMDNIDLAGSHFDVFCRDILQDALVAGHAAILVEFPSTGGGQTAAAERGSDPIRPYWVPIKKDNIVSWRTTIIGGRLVLTQLVLKECQYVADGAFGEKEQTQYRIFQRSDTGVVTFTLVGITDRKVVFLVDSGTYQNQTEIPIAEIKTNGSTSLFESVPPLLDLAFLNIAHYQQYSDYAISMHKTSFPTLVLTGWPEAQNGQTSIVVGPNTTLRTTADTAKAQWISHDGNALASAKQSLDDLKSDMGTLGISMLSPSKRTAETAQAKRLDKSTENSALAVTSRALQDGIETALDFHANYLKLDDGGTVKFNREFDDQTMQADMLTAWTGAVSNAGVPSRFMLSAMQEGELIGPDEDIDAIDAEMAANQAAIDAQKAAETAAMNQPPAKPAPKAAA